MTVLEHGLFKEGCEYSRLPIHFNALDSGTPTANIEAYHEQEDEGIVRKASFPDPWAAELPNKLEMYEITVQQHIMTRHM